MRYDVGLLAALAGAVFTALNRCECCSCTVSGEGPSAPLYPSAESLRPSPSFPSVKLWQILATWSLSLLTWIGDARPSSSASSSASSSVSFPSLPAPEMPRERRAWIPKTSPNSVLLHRHICRCSCSLLCNPLFFCKVTASPLSCDLSPTSTSTICYTQCRRQYHSISNTTTNAADDGGKASAFPSSPQPISFLNAADVK